MMDWVLPTCRQTVKVVTVLTLLLLGCLATGAIARSWQGQKRSLDLPETSDECEQTNGAEQCVEVQKQEQRERPFDFCHQLMHGTVERTIRNCLEDLLSECSEEVKNTQQDLVQNEVAIMGEMCYGRDPEFEEVDPNSECDPARCLRPLLREADTELDIMTMISLLVTPSSEVALKQGPLCRAMDAVALRAINSCMEEADQVCSSQPSSSPDNLRTMYNMTRAIGNIQQLCEPGCENLNDKIDARDLCLQNLADTVQDCNQIQEGIQCVMEQIRCCSILVDQFRERLDQTIHVDECPNLTVDLSCNGAGPEGGEQGEGGGDGVGMGGGDDSGKGEQHPGDNYQGDQHQASTNSDSAASSLLLVSKYSRSHVLVTSLAMLTYLLSSQFPADFSSYR